MDEKKISSKRLKALRKAHGYTQDFVASRLDIARQTYSHYENGRRVPTYDVVAKIADLYDISMDDLGNYHKQENCIEEDCPKEASIKSQELQNFLDYCNDAQNTPKLKFLNQKEKEMLYYFDKVADSNKWELLEFAKILAKKH